MVKSLKFKRGQLNIQQMIFMLIAIALFFALIGIIVLGMIMSNLKEKSKYLAEEKAIILTLSLANTPEFSCGELYGGAKTSSCVDFDKAIQLKEVSQKYKNLWEVKGIEIRRIYPKIGTVECTLKNYPECDVLTVLKAEQGIGYSGFISLCRNELNQEQVSFKCELAKIIVTN